MSRVSLVLILLVACIALSGCGRGLTISGTTFYLTTGYDEAALIRGGDVRLTAAQGRLLADCVRLGYEEVFGTEVWERSVDGLPLKDYVSISVKDMAVKLVLINMLADSSGINLSQDEMAAAMERAERFYSEHDGELEYISADETNSLFVMMAVTDKVYYAVTKSVDSDISIDEARIIRIQYIYSKDSMKKMWDALDEIEAGADFASVAAKYSDSSVYSAEIGRGELISEFEEAAFNLNIDEVSTVIACDNGFYIIKCVDDHLEEKNEAQAAKLVANRMRARFNQVLDEFAVGKTLYFDEKVWDGIE